jgi:hypothetical protein
MSLLDRLAAKATEAIDSAVTAVTTAVTGAVASLTEEAKRQAREKVEQKVKDILGDAAGEFASVFVEDAAKNGVDITNPNALLTEAERLAKEKKAALEAEASSAADAAITKVTAEKVARQLEVARKNAAAAYKEIYTSTEYSDPYFEDPENPKLSNEYRLTRYEDWSAASDENDNKSVSVDLPFVHRITMQAPNAVSRTRTLAGAVYAEHAGFIQRTFVIEGRSGAVWNADGADRLAISRFTALRNFLEAYGKEHAANKNAFFRFKNSRLVLRATFESEAVFCDVTNFTYRRSTDTSTYSFEYSLTIVTNGFVGSGSQAGRLLDIGSKTTPTWIPADNFYQPNLLSSRNPAAFRILFGGMPREADTVRNFLNWNESRNQLSTLSCSALQDIRSSVSVLNSALDTSVWTFNSTISDFTDSIRSRAETKAALAWGSLGLDLAHTFKGLGGTPCPVPVWSDLYYNAAPYVNAGAAAIEYLKDQFGTTRGTEYSYTITNTQPVRTAFEARATTSPTPPFAAVNHFVTVNGADAYSIAAAALGDINQYWRIISLNNMRDAYTRADGTPLSPGSAVLVPNAAVPASRATDVLGTDLLLVNGDLMLVGNNDVMRVSGYANYTQNLLNRMRTPRGSNRVFPRYGLSSTIHTRSDATVPATIRTEVSSQVMQDYRTEDVGNIQLEVRADTVKVSMVVTAITTPKRIFTFNYDLNSQVTA